MINTGVSNQLRQPATYHVFTYQFAARSLVPLPLRVALIGAKSAAGTATPGTLYECSDATQTDALFGVGSELALGLRAAYATGARLQRGPRLYAICIAEPGAGVANVKTITGTGAATADGTIIIRVAGRTFHVGVRSGDSVNTIATAIANTLKTYAETLPVVVTVATNVVTLTHVTKGINGADVQVSVDQNVTGNTQVVANTATGTGVTDHQVALDALGSLPFDGVAMANHAAADITQINTDIASRWSYIEKRWRWYFIGEPGTIGTATALASAANHQAVVIASMEGCLNTALEMAASLAVGVFSRERPNANYDGLKLPLYPPNAATVYTPTEVETAIAAGLTPLTAIVDPYTKAVTSGVAKVERLITTKTTTGSPAVPFEVLRDIGVSRTGVYVAQQIDVAYQERFGSDANPDGTLLTDDTVDQVRDMVEDILRECERSNILRNVEFDLVRLVVERDSISPGRLNVDVPYTVVVGLHQIAFIHRVQI